MIGLHKIDIIASMFKRLLFYVIQWIWGFPQNLAGFLVWLFEGKDKHKGTYKNVQVTRWNKDRSLSLGMFIFLGYATDERMIKHEYGHSIQSLILGPAYLIAVGIPSFIWCNFYPIAKRWKSGKVSYFSRYPESWADRLGFGNIV